jgi:hypothetical protein
VDNTDMNFREMGFEDGKVDGIGSESFPLVSVCWWAFIAVAFNIWVFTIRGFGFYSIVITILIFVYRERWRVVLTNEECFCLFFKKCRFSTFNACTLCFEENLIKVNK